MDKSQYQQVSDSQCCTDKGISLEATQFTLEILKSLPQIENNSIAFSPVSIYSLLAVLHQGSNGSSRAEMNGILHNTPNAAGDAVKNLSANIKNSDSSPSLKLLWKSRKKNDSTSELEQVSSQGQEEQSSTPRAFCRNSSRSFAALTNMLCFNGFWSQEGLLKTEMDFCPSPEEQFETGGIQMKKNSFCGTIAEIGAKWIHIPIAVKKKSDDTAQCVGVRPSCKSYWSRRKMTLMIMLPTDRHGLDKLIQNLSPEHLVKSFDYSPKNDRKNLELTLPAFQINSTTDFKPVLKKLGLQSVFGHKSGLSDVTAEQRLFLSNIVQKGQIVVDQFGARTSQEAETNFPCLFCEPWEETEPCIVNEPFLFFIVDKETLLPLIAGKVTKPESPSWEPFGDDQFDDDFSQCQEY